jgi:hypothetical protein
MKILPHQPREWERATVTVLSASAFLAALVFCWSRRVQDLEQTYVMGLWPFIHRWYVTSLWASTVLALAMVVLGWHLLAKRDWRYGILAVVVATGCLCLWMFYSSALPR